MIEETHRTKNIHYRQAGFFQDTDLTLQDLMESALLKKPSVKSRLRIRADDSNKKTDPEESEKEKEFINTHITRFGIFFGNLLKYESGANKHTLTVDDNVAECDVEQLAPPRTKGGQRREFLDSILYFAVFGNNVVILQSLGLGSRDLESHLNWLLCTTDLFDKQRVYLNQEVSDEAKEKILNAPTKKLKMNVPITGDEDMTVSIPLPSQSGSDSNLQAKNIKFRPEGKFIDILKAVGFMNESNKELFDEVAKGTNLDVTVEVSYKRSAKKDTQKLINNITHTLRHSDMENFEVEFKGAGKLKGNKLIISTKISFKYINGLLEPGDFYTKIHDWIQLRIKEGILKG